LRRYRTSNPSAEAADSPEWDPDAVTEASERRHRVTRDPVVMDHAERLAGLGSWEWVPATGELVWSDNLFRVYGLEIGAIIPAPEYVVKRVHPDDLEQVIATLEALTAGEPRSVEYRFRRDDGEGILLRATVAMVSESEAGDLRIVGLVQDLTAQRRLEREVAARVAVTEALESWRTLDDSATALLAGLARAMGFVFGALWAHDDERFAVRAMWHAASAELEWVATATVQWRPGPASPTIGRAFSMGQPILVTDLSASAPRDRVMAIRQAGIETALAVPAVFEHETMAVLEFLSVESVAITDRLSRALYGIGHEIGHFLAGHRGELVGAALTPRAVEVLQLAARGCGAEAIAGQMGVSTATIKRHFERAYMQLGVSGRAAAVAEAMRRGLIS
jgi:DNA-binding CsgD family transcriptional regulator